MCGSGQNATINVFVDEESVSQFRTERAPLVIPEVVQDDEEYLFPLVQQGEYLGFEDIRAHQRTVFGVGNPLFVVFAYEFGKSQIGFRFLHA